RCASAERRPQPREPAKTRRSHGVCSLRSRGVRTLAPMRRHRVGVGTLLLAAIGCASGTPGSMTTQSNQATPAEHALPQVAVADAGALCREMGTGEVPGSLRGVVWVRGGDLRGAKFVVVATHGASDNPESSCSFWQKIVGDRAFVLCTRGKRIENGAFF